MKMAARKKNNKNEVCSARESTNRCLLKPIELPEAFWFEPIFQGLGEYKARSLKRSVVFTVSESSRKG